MIGPEAFCHAAVSDDDGDLCAAGARVYAASEDKKCWLRIVREGDAGYSSYSVRACFDLGHGYFCGANDDVQFLNGPTFVSALDRFVAAGDGALLLSGTYNTSVTLSRGTKAGETVLGVVIGDLFCGVSPAGDYLLRGQFCIASDELVSLAAACKAMFAGQ